MTDKRISPLQWLSTKFASLNHSHNEYLTSHQDISGKEDKSNKVTSLSSSSTDTQYPSAKCVNDLFDDLGDYVASKESSSNKVTSISDYTGSTSKYPNVKAVEDYAQPKGNYLTQHQSLKTINNETITGTGNITIDSGSDIDIVTDWEQTLSDEKVASEKLVKESIDSVLYTTEDLELGTPTTSSNVTYTYTRPYAEQDTSFSISTLNTVSIPQPSNEMRADIYDYVVDVSFPMDENAILIFGDSYGCALFYESPYDIFIGFDVGGNRISGSSVCHPRGNSLDYHLVLRKLNDDEYRIFLNDTNDRYMDIYIYDSLIKYSDNISINISAQRINIPTKLSRYIDDIEKLQYLPDGSDLDFLTENKSYIGSNDEYSTISHCPVSNKNFFVKNIPLGEFGSGDMYQQTLITLNDGANTEVWVHTQIITGGYSGTWVKLATGNGSGGSVTVDSSWVNNSTNPVESQLIKTALDGKSDTSHTHSQYLTEHQSLTNYVQKSSTTGLIKNDGTIMSGGTGSTNYAIGNHTHSSYVNPTIADNLTTNDSSQVLSAKQGKVLNDLIGQAISYINQ